MIYFAENHDYWQKIFEPFQVRRKENTLYTSVWSLNPSCWVGCDVAARIPKAVVDPVAAGGGLCHYGE